MEPTRIAAMAPRFVMLVLLAAGLANAQDDGLATIKEQELEQVREQIRQLKASMDEAASDRDRLTVELQEVEAAIATQRRRISEIEAQLAAARRRKDALNADLDKREQELSLESSELAAQVRMAYMSGSQEKIRLLLNLEDPATVGRLMAYYRYLNDYRSGNIDAVTQKIQELEVLRSDIAAEAARLEELAKSRYAELTRLNTAQEERRTLLATLQQRIDDGGRQVKRLAAEEKDLQRLITELTSILSDYPITSEQPFSSHKGNLTWPVAGTLLFDFGQPRVEGSVKWNGVVLAAPRGREVRAVYHGRVAFADWLAGMGLLVIVDHGEGFMTLYGYNETLLKNAGDWVAPGDVIATVGDSGGQPQAALYFEIRSRGQPVNPRRWVSKRPGQ